MARTMFVGGKVFTGESETAFAQAFEVDGARITWVGSTEEATARAGNAATVDLDGATVLPGLIDVHHHPVLTATLAPGICLLPPKVDTVDDIVELMRTHPALENDTDDWILGWGYDEQYMSDGRQLTRHDLDRVSTDRPVLVRRSDVHSASCNTEALRRAGITAETPDPFGARFEREPDGTPNGTLTEFAAVEAVAEAMPPLTQETLVNALVGVGQHFASQGIVAVGDLAAAQMSDSLPLLREAEAAGMRQRVNVYLPWSDLSQAPRTLTDEEKSGRVRIAGVKVFCDGAISNRTAWMTKPYRSDETPDTKTATPERADAGRPLSNEDRAATDTSGAAVHHGSRTASDAEILAAMAWCRENEVQLALHAMGDAAIANLLDLVADTDPWLTGVPSVRVEHASLLTQELQQRIETARVGVAVVTHAIFDWAEHATYAAALSDEQMADTYPLRRLYLGHRASALASDTPATTYEDADNVFVSVQSAVQRIALDGADLRRDQTLTVPQAILMYTGRAALVAPAGGLGRIVEGASADFVTLDRDVFACDESELAQVKVTGTWIEGEKVYTRGAGEVS